MKTRITRELLTPIVAECLSIRQVIKTLGLVPAGGNYKTVHAKITQFQLNTSHFTGAAWNVGLRYSNFGKTCGLAEILVENSSYSSTYGLKRRLLKEGVKQHQCEHCGLAQWQGVLIPLELHHLNGTNTDHRIENLQLLCPNCHALTHNYRGKNQTRTKSQSDEIGRH